MRPSRALKRERKSFFIIVIYFISMLSLSISFLYVSSAKSGLFGIAFTALSFFMYFLLSTLVNAMLIHFFASMFLTLDKKYSVKNLTLDMIFVYRIFILLLPLSLLFSVFPEVVYKAYFFMVLVALFIYYLYNMYFVIKNNFASADGAQILLFMALPVIFCGVKFFFIVFNINILARVLMAFFF